MGSSRSQRLGHTSTALPARLIAHLTAFAGCAAVLHPSAASARSGRPVPPAGPAFEAPPWSGSEGFPPPRPLARTRAATPAPHRALHPESEPVGPPVPLFPRAGDVVDRRAARKAAMERHPAGKASARFPNHAKQASTPASRGGRTVRSLSEPPRDEVRISRVCPRKHRVEPGETLWGIASRWSPSDRPLDILRLTMEIYRLNRDVIGADPDLILPGQLLSLPERCTR